MEKFKIEEVEVETKEEKKDEKDDLIKAITKIADYGIRDSHGGYCDNMDKVRKLIRKYENPDYDKEIEAEK